MLVDGSESDEGAGAQSREPEGKEEEPAAAIDPDSGLGPMTADGGRSGTRHAGAKHADISRRTQRPIEGCGDEVVKGWAGASLCGQRFVQADPPVQSRQP